jgi:hypothetical protein
MELRENYFSGCNIIIFKILSHFDGFFVKIYHLKFLQQHGSSINSQFTYLHMVHNLNYRQIEMQTKGIRIVDRHVIPLELKPKIRKSSITNKEQ